MARPEDPEVPPGIFYNQQKGLHPGSERVTL